MQTYLRVAILASCWMAWMHTQPASAQSSDERRTIEQLEQENDALRQELAQLRLELSQLKRELAKQQPIPADEAETTETGQAESDETRAFRSIDEIYRRIPNHVRPTDDGWGPADRHTVSEWLIDNTHGKRFEARKRIKEVNVKYDPTARLWQVILSFEDETMNYRGWKMQEKLVPITLPGDKTFAESAQKRFRVGATIQVTGTITNIGWDLPVRRDDDTPWRPTFCELQLDAELPR